jgi:hypothetical protein
VYVEDGVDGLHGEGFLYLNDEEVDHFLIRLEEVDGVVGLTDKYFAVFAGEELDEFFVYDGGVSEFEGAVEEGDVVGVVLGQVLL